MHGRGEGRFLSSLWLRRRGIGISRRIRKDSPTGSEVADDIKHIVYRKRYVSDAFSFGLFRPFHLLVHFGLCKSHSRQAYY